MKKYKPRKTLPRFLDSAVEQVFEEIWSFMYTEHDEYCYFSKVDTVDKKDFKKNVLVLLNKMRKKCFKVNK